MKDRSLDPPDDIIDYDREEERIEQARADDVDKMWDAINKGDLKTLSDMLHEVCLECGKRPAYEGDYCEKCQMKRKIANAEWLLDARKGH